MHHPSGVHPIEARPIPKTHERRTRFKIVAFLFAAMWLAASDARAQSVFETHVGRGSPGGAVLNFGVAWFRVQNDSVEFQAILQGHAWPTASLQPVLLLPGGDLPFSFGTGQPFTVNMGFHYQNPFVPAPPFDPNAPVTANYFEGTLFSGSFQAFPGLESQLLSEAARLRLTYDNGSISGPLAFVAVPEPSPIVLLCVGTALLALRLRQARPQQAFA